MKLKNLQELVEGWLAADDWADAEVVVQDSNGNNIAIPENIEVAHELNGDGRDVLVFVSPI